MITLLLLPVGSGGNGSGGAGGASAAGNSCCEAQLDVNILLRLLFGFGCRAEDEAADEKKMRGTIGAGS